MQVSTLKTCQCLTRTGLESPLLLTSRLSPPPSMRPTTLPTSQRENSWRWTSCLQLLWLLLMALLEPTRWLVLLRLQAWWALEMDGDSLEMDIWTRWFAEELTTPWTRWASTQWSCKLLLFRSSHFISKSIWEIPTYFLSLLYFCSPLISMWALFYLYFNYLCLLCMDGWT